MKASILDVGCGNRPHGHVNVDLYPEETTYRTWKPEVLAPALDTKKIPNFIKADACFLPFKSNVFHLVYSSHTIEHVENPRLMLREILRVSRDRVILICPHRYSQTTIKKSRHKHFFNRKWFHHELSRSNEISFEISFEIKYSEYRYLPHDLIPLIKLPKEMTIKIRKLRTW